MFIQGDAQQLPLASNSVNSIIFSPPYYGMRVYDGPQARVWPLRFSVQGCSHKSLETAKRAQLMEVDPTKRGNMLESAFCKCGAWYGALGAEPSPELYIDHMVQLIMEFARVLTPDGTIFMNIADVYQSGKGRSGHGNPGDQEKRLRARKSVDKPQAHVGGFGRTRPTDIPHPIFKPKDLIPVSWMIAIEVQRMGLWMRAYAPWLKDRAMPDSAVDRWNMKSHEHIFMFNKSGMYFHDPYDVSFPAAKASIERERRGVKDVKMGQGIPGLGVNTYHQERENDPTRPVSGTRRFRSTDFRSTPGQKDSGHYAYFPPALVNPMIKMSTSRGGRCPGCKLQYRPVVERQYEGNIYFDRVVGWEAPCECGAGTEPAVVLDPFCGTGTTAIAAQNLGRRGIGLDLSRLYLREAADTATLDFGGNNESIPETNDFGPLFDLVASQD